MRTAVLLTALVLLTACDARVKDTEPAAPTATAVREVKPNYVMRDGIEYGYEKALSEDDRKKGQVTAPLMMFSYLGRKDGLYQIVNKQGTIRYVAECSKPCEFAKIYTFDRDRFMGKEVMKLTGDALLSHVFADATSGKLDQMIGTRNDDRVTYWVDGAAKRLIVASQATSGVER
jgi:hypothetical protein